MKKKGFFITGTDTDVGKTYIGAQIAESLHRMGIAVMPRKPIESGCQLINGVLQPDDATQYFEAIEKSISLEDICPFRFEPAISPQRAARLVNQPVSVEETRQACLKNINANDFLIVEGAGGFYSPLCEDGLNADLAETLALPVLLVANDQLGCINHILLTTEAIRQRNLKLSAIVLNRKDRAHDDAMNNLEDLKTLLDIPIFSVTKNERIQSESSLIKHLIK